MGRVSDFLSSGVVVFIFFLIFLPLSVGAASFLVNINAPDAIAPGESLTVSYSVIQANYPAQCTLMASDGWVESFDVLNVAQSSGSRSFTPNAAISSITYTLKCTDSAFQTRQDSTTIYVSSKPVVSLGYSSNPDPLPEGGGVTFVNWDVSLATSCSATGGTAEWRSLSDLHLGGSLPFTISTTTEFFLECFNAEGESSGKQSVRVPVGAFGLCGNGIVDVAVGEQCDDGSDNSPGNYCTARSNCSNECKWIGQCGAVCGNGIIDAFFDPTCSGDACYEACDRGSENGACPALCSNACTENTNCVGGMKVTFGASKQRITLGDSVQLRYTIENAVSCIGSDEGEGFSVNGTVSGEQTVRPSKTGRYEASLTCTDKQGQVLERRVEVTVGEVGLEMDIVKFAVEPSTIPFSYAGDIVFTWRGSNIGYCFLTRPGSNIAFSDQVTGDIGRYTIPVNQLPLVDSYRKSGQPYRVRLNCVGISPQEKENSELVMYFGTSPIAAPTVSVKIGTGQSRDTTKTVASGTNVTIYRSLGDAERCEWTDSRTGTTSLAPFIGEQSVVATIKVPTTFTLECWNGNLSSKASAIVNITQSTDLPPGGSLPPSTNPSLCSAPNTCESSCATANRIGLCSTGVYCCSPMAAAQPAQNSSFSFGNVLGFTTVDGLLSKILSYLQGIIVIFALIFIVIGAFLYITSAGNDSQMETGKKAILAALIGLALGIAAPTFLKEIYSVLGASSSSVPASLSLLQIATNILSFLLTIIGIITIIMLVIGGMLYLTAAGNEDQIDKGKKIVKYSIIGITIALAALVLVKQVAKFFVG